MNQLRNEQAIETAYALACDFHITLEHLAEDCPELQENAKIADRLAQTLGKLWSDCGEADEMA